MNEKQKLVLFDFDGVIIDSLEVGRKKYSAILETLGRHPLTDEEFEFMKQSSPSELLTYCLKDQELIQKAIELRNSPEFAEEVEVELVDGVKETLENLSEHYLLGIVTSRDETVYSLIEKFGLGQYFKAGVVSNKDYSKEEFKPHPKPLHLAMGRNGYLQNKKDVVYVGDAQTDYEAAKNAGIKFIGFGNVGEENVTKLLDLEQKISKLLYV